MWITHPGVSPMLLLMLLLLPLLILAAFPLLPGLNGDLEILPLWFFHPLFTLAQSYCGDARGAEFKRKFYLIEGIPFLTTVVYDTPL